MSFNIEVEGGTSVRLPTAGKYCDRDIVITATGGGGGGGSVGEFSQYAKVIATPQSTTSFAIENPLGGIAKKVFVTRLATDAPSSRKIKQYIADLDFRMGVLYAVASSGSARYTVTAVDSGVNNGNFMMTDGKITLYRFNSSNTWDANSEYEVEIYQ